MYLLLHFIRTFNISYFKYLHKFNKQTGRKHDFFTNKQEFPFIKQ